MKKIYAFVTIAVTLIALILASCSAGYSFTENEDKTITRSDGKVYYPLENSHRYSHLGKTAKSGDILILENDSIIEVGKTYYVTEEYKSLDVLFEECLEFFYVDRKELKDGRITESIIEKADKLSGKDAEDFSFYVFYGREPKELGLEKGVHQGEICALFETDLPLVSAYSVYKWSESIYSVKIDGVQYTLEDKWLKKIGISD